MPPRPAAVDAADMAAPDALTWTLPWPTGVTTNHLYTGYGRRRCLTAPARRWRDEVICVIRQDFIDRKAPLRLPDGPLAFRVRYWPPRDKRKHDPDNILKFAIDCTFAAFFADDERVYRAEAIRQDRSDAPRLVVTVYPLADGGPVAIDG